MFIRTWGMMYLTLTPAQYEDIQAWQDEHQVQVIFPAITDAKQTNANIWYEVSKKGAPKLKNGEVNPIYRTTTVSDTSYHRCASRRTMTRKSRWRMPA